MASAWANGLWTDVFSPCRRYARMYSSAAYASWVTKLVAHSLCTASWVFLATFGSVREAQQLSGIDLLCGGGNGGATTDPSHPPPSPSIPPPPVATEPPLGSLASGGGGSNTVSCPHPYSASCCASEPYNIAYNLLNVVGGSLGAAQLSYFLSGLIYRATMAMSCTNFVFLMQAHLRLAVGVPMFVAGAFVYEHLAYTAFFCGHNAAFCAHAPAHLWTLAGVYKSLLAVGTVLVLMHTAYVGLLMWTFVMRRLDTWHRIAATEECLMVTPEIQAAFESRSIVRRTHDIRDFLHRWSARSDDAIIEELPARAACVMRVLAKEGMDEDGDHRITRAEFDAFAERHSVVERDRLWRVLSSSGAHDCLTRESIEDLLYELYFDRKHLANAILSDHQVFRLLVLYLSATLYPAVAIVVSKIFGYDNAFGQGIDLFKTYAVIASYIYGTMAEDVKFLLLMVKRRPFNRGDVLELDGQTYDVVSFDASHAELVGSTSNTVRTSKLLDSSTLNLSANGFSDSFDVTVPLNATYDQEDLLGAIRRYMKANPREVRHGSVRCGWVGIDADGKRLRVNWRYRFRILDRSRLNMARTRLLNALVMGCNREVTRACFVAQVANGGGLNDADKGEADKGEADKGEADKGEADKGEADKGEADKAKKMNR